MYNRIHKKGFTAHFQTDSTMRSKIRVENAALNLRCAVLLCVQHIQRTDRCSLKIMTRKDIDK